MATVKYLFKYDQGYIFEICREGKAKEEKYAWFILKGPQPEKLVFKKMTDKTREFEDGTYLTFNTNELKYQNQTYKFNNCNNFDLKQIQPFLSSFC